MKNQDVKVLIPGGLEARTTAMAVQIAGQFDSVIYIESDNKRINAKSIMGMMALGLGELSEITISAEGADEEEACAALAKYIENR